MQGIKLLIVILPRGKGEEAAKLCRENGLTFSMISPAYGAAGTHFMDYLGLSDSEKDCVFTVVRSEFSHEMLTRIHRYFRMNEPNTGIAISLSITGVSGPRALRYISGIYPPPQSAGDFTETASPQQQNRPQSGEGVDTMGITEKKNKKADKISPSAVTQTTEPGGMRTFDLIITIVNRGFSDLAIEASKTAGAKGGTVLHARGTGVHEVERFFSISIQPEKEVILSLVRHKATKEVMHAIIEAAGLQTEGKGLCFSLPVDEVTGIARWLTADGSEAEPPAPAVQPSPDSGRKKK
ncbi:P-II family nitrogen regulator [Bacilliculturomica massiliensis]|uniref:P-II family nitrogen regulator n=1 Tax=Bacilliculturomica massiliensis TaxID=1917867 RepID=UPI001A90FFCB|nr:P-II family nitrogen regulator [Bacilliculturomica massiliensis]